MAKASDNDFPSILVTEQASKPTAPAAGKQRLYMKTDHKLYHENSGGTETEVGGAITAFYPTRATMWHDEALVTAGGGSLVRGVNTAQLYNGYTSLSSNANADAFSQSFMLKAGTYTFTVLGYKSGDTGKIDWAIDGANVITGQDWYGADIANSVIATGSITVTGSGRHLLTGTINGKNASSSGYGLRLNKYWFTPSSDGAEV